MTAFDTDVLSDLFWNVPDVVNRIALIPADEHAVPVVVVEEILRGRLSAIRKAQSGQRGLTIDRAYGELEKSLEDIRRFRVLSYTPAADAIFRAWTAAKVRVGSQDLRIAAIAAAHGAKLVTRNAQDYSLIPGFTFDEWKQ